LSRGLGDVYRDRIWGARRGVFGEYRPSSAATI
jgi:hypothetical protein